MVARSRRSYHHRHRESMYQEASAPPPSPLLLLLRSARPPLLSKEADFILTSDLDHPHLVDDHRERAVPAARRAGGAFRVFAGGHLQGHDLLTAHHRHRLVQDLLERIRLCLRTRHRHGLAHPALAGARVSAPEAVARRGAKRVRPLLMASGCYVSFRFRSVSQALQDALELMPGVDRAFVHVDHEVSHAPEHRKNK